MNRKYWYLFKYIGVTKYYLCVSKQGNLDWLPINRGKPYLYADKADCMAQKEQFGDNSIHIKEISVEL